MMTLSCVLFAVCAPAATVHLDGSRDDVVVLAGRAAAEVKDAIVLPANACESHREAARKPPKLTKLRHNVTPCLCSIECRRNVPLGPEGAKAITNLGEGTNAENSLEVIEKRTDEVDENRTWYAFKPVRLREKFAFEVGSGLWNHGGGIGATKEVILDQVEIVRKGAASATAAK